MKRAQFVTIAAVSLFAASLFASGLSKYKGWDKSPQGYLMTAAERGQWSNIQTDDEADKFVKDFLARRSPSFVADINRAATNADKYFTDGKIQGSTTARGKLVIILGPPGGLSLSDKPIRGDRRSAPSGASNINEGVGGGGFGASVSDMMGAVTGPGSASAVIHVFTFTYAADKLPAAYGKPLTVNIEVDPSGNDHIADRKTQAELDRLYEMVAETKLTPPAPPSAKQ